MRQRGFTVIEWAVASALWSIASIAVLLYASNLLHHSARLTLLSDGIYGVVRTYQAFSRVMADLDTHRLELSPRVHEDGFISYTDGTPLSVMSGAVIRRPKGDALTGLAAFPASLQKVERTARSMTGFSVSCCPAPGNAALPPHLRSFLVLSTDGISEMQGTIVQRHLTSGCTDILLRDGRSVSVPQLAHPPFQALIGIERHYTYYRDGSGALRYLSHAGEELLENQPVTRSAPRFALTLQRDAPSQRLTATLSIASHRASFSISSHLARLTHLHYVFEAFRSK